MMVVGGNMRNRDMNNTKREKADITETSWLEWWRVLR